jgi:hypothetical protein
VRVREEEEADVVMCNPPPLEEVEQYWMIEDSSKDKEVNPSAMIAVGEREEEEDPPNVHDVMEREPVEEREIKGSV